MADSAASTLLGVWLFSMAVVLGDALLRRPSPVRGLAAIFAALWGPIGALVYFLLLRDWLVSPDWAEPARRGLRHDPTIRDGRER